MPKPIPALCFALQLLWAGASAAAGGIACQAAENRIMVADYPEEHPATLDDVLAADRKHGWNRVTHDPATDTFAIQASLWIGATNDLGTFFQIGRSNHPRETVVLHGDLVVAAPRPSPQRQDGRLRISNRLTLGDPADTNIRATVKIACSRPNEFAVRLLAGREGYPAGTQPVIPRGELFMFNGTLTAATPDAGHAYAAAIELSHAGVNFQMAGATFSWWNGDLFKMAFTPYDHWPKSDIMRGMVFEHGGAVRYGSYADSVFRDLDLALYGGAVRCVFENNRENVAPHANHTGAALLDCVVSPPARPLKVPRTKRDLTQLRVNGINAHARDLRVVANPGVVERVSLPVKVVDDQGRPVPRATVWLSCPDDPDGAAVVRRLAVTGQDGLTPGVGNDQALVIATREWRPTDNPAAPEQITYRYRVRAEAPGYARQEVKVDGVAEIQCPLVVVMRKPGGKG